MEDTVIKIGKNLLSLRKRKGLTQTEVAQYINKSHFAYCNYETGKRMIGIDDLEKLAILFDVSIDDIINSPVTYNRKKVIAFPTYDSNGKTDLTKIEYDDENIILFIISEYETEYYLRSNEIIYNEKVLIKTDTSSFPALVSRSDDPSGYFVTNLIIKETKFYNNTAFKNSILILGRYAGKISKEIIIPNFL